MAETVLPGELLTQEEIRIISACLLAAEEGPFFSDWEFQTLFGVERPVLRNVRLHWPDVSLSDEAVRASVFNSLAHLLAYPHGEQKSLLGYVPEGQNKIRDILIILSNLELPRDAP